MVVKILNTLKKWIREIRAVGIVDWVWFVIYLERNEFHDKLDLLRYYPDLVRLARDRDRAHRIDMVLENLK